MKIDGKKSSQKVGANNDFLDVHGHPWLWPNFYSKLNGGIQLEPWMSMDMDVALFYGCSIIIRNSMGIESHRN